MFAKMTRRDILSAMAGLPFMPVSAGLAQSSASPLLRRIDVHCHYVPPEYRRAAEAAGHSHPDGMPGLPKWDPELAIAIMDRINISTGILSVSSPGIHFGDRDAARKLARYVNEEGARAVKDYAGRFGLFASLPSPDVDGSLEEIRYAFDVLKAEGVILLTNQRGIYLGDKSLDPIFAELHQRQAVLFIHPTSPFCPGCLDLALGYPRPMIEFMFDTTRAVTNMLFAGTLDRFPNIRIIVPHAGATVPVLVDRILQNSPLIRTLSADELFSKLRGLYYDLAGPQAPRMLGPLLQIADSGHIMYGSDWPFTPEQGVVAAARNLTEISLLDEAMRQRIFQQNAMTLFPRLRT